MSRVGLIYYTGLFLLLVFLQVFLFDKIHLFGYATPMLSVYFIIKLPVGDSHRIANMLLTALLGLTIDLFGGVLGVNMLACVLVNFVRPWLLDRFVTEDIHNNYTPSTYDMGKSLFLQFAFVMVLLHHATVYIVEACSLFDFWGLIFRITGSVIVTMLLVAAMENFRFDPGK